MREIDLVIWRRVRRYEKAKDAAGCRASAELWESLNPRDPRGLYNAACYRGVTAAVLRATDGSPQAASSVAAEADRAMEWLGKAVAAGYAHSAQMMKRDRDLDALRGREDFKKLFASVEAKLEENLAAAREAVRRDLNDLPQRNTLKALLNDRAWALATDPDAAERDPARAVRLAEELLALVPHDTQGWNTLGAARYRAGDWDGAIAALQKYRELRTDDAEWSNPFLLAMAHWEKGEHAEARRWYGVGADWMEKTRSTSDTLTRVRREAAELLGVKETK
jgi:tetratricopeptide (TPR) repeat protein